MGNVVPSIIQNYRTEIYIYILLHRPMAAWHSIKFTFAVSIGKSKIFSRPSGYIMLLHKIN